MVCLGRPHHFRFFKGSHPQILIGPFLNTLTHILWHHHSPDRTSQIYSRLLVVKWGKEESYSVANNCNSFFGFIYLLINVMFKGTFLIKIYPQVLFYGYLLNHQVIKRYRVNDALHMSNVKKLLLCLDVKDVD